MNHLSKQVLTFVTQHYSQLESWLGRLSDSLASLLDEEKKREVEDAKYMARLEGLETQFLAHNSSLKELISSIERQNDVLESLGSKDKSTPD